MFNIMVYRPGCAQRRTVFENQLLLYNNLQKEADLNFSIVVDEDSFENDNRFQWYPLPESTWKSFRGRRWFLYKNWKLGQLRRIAEKASRIITLDPTVYPQAHLIFETARRLDIPVWIDSTITLLGESLFGYWNRFSKRKVIQDLKQCEVIMIPTPKVMERYAALGLLLPEIANKFRILGHPIESSVSDLPLLDYVPETSRFVCVSRLTAAKGIAYILESFLELLSQYPGCTLTFLGDGEMRQYIEQRSDSHFGKSIFIHSNVPHSELANFLRNFDCYVSHPLEMPYWEEYFGVTTLEAMAAGLNAITTPTGGIPFVFRGCRDIEFVPSRDIRALTDAMVRHCRTTIADRKQKASANRDFLDLHYSLDAISRKWMHYHQDCVIKSGNT